MRKRKKSDADSFFGLFLLVILVGVLAQLFSNDSGDMNRFVSGLMTTVYLPIVLALLTYVLSLYGTRSTMMLDLLLIDRNPNKQEPLWVPDEECEDQVCTFLQIRNAGNACPTELLVKITEDERERVYKIPKGVPVDGKIVLRANVDMKKIQSVVVGCYFSVGWWFITFEGERSKNGSCMVFGSYQNSTQTWWPDEKEDSCIKCHWGYSGS